MLIIFNFRAFADEVTKWLQCALHVQPDMRGGVVSDNEEARCLTDMENILSIKV